MTSVTLPVRIPGAPQPLSAVPTPGLRLALKPAGPASGLLDGAWWPYSDDLVRELPVLVAELDRIWGRITRVTVNPRYWRQPLPGRLPIAGHVVRIGWFTIEQDPHKLLLLSFGLRRCDLLVVPPSTDPATAAHLMAAATDPAGRQTASALLAGEHAGPAAAVTLAADTDSASATAWESDGGALASASLRLGRLLDPTTGG